jgi:small subunit ribosomal protein S20
MPHIPVHPSAEKRQRQNLKRHERNRAVKTHARSVAKEASEAIVAGDATKALAQLRLAIKVLDKAASAGTFHRNTVRRKVARLSASYHQKYGTASAAPAPQA